MVEKAMNLSVLSMETMLAHGAWWGRNEEIRGVLGQHPLAEAAFNQVLVVTDRLSEQRHARFQIEEKIEFLSQELVTQKQIFARKTRALHHYLTGLIEDSDDPGAATRYRDLRALLFPQGLSVVHSSYFDGPGTMIQIKTAVTSERLAFLAGVRVGERTLADIYHEWIAAAELIGHAVQERERLRASIARGGSQSRRTDARRLRQEWIRTVRLFLEAIEVLGLADKVSELIHAQLRQSASRAAQRPAPGDVVAAPAAESAPEPTAEPAAELARPTPEPSARHLHDRASSLHDSRSGKLLSKEPELPAIFPRPGAARICGEAPTARQALAASPTEPMR